MKAALVNHLWLIFLVAVAVTAFLYLATTPPVSPVG